MDQKRLLNYMYSKHLVNPKYIELSLTKDSETLPSTKIAIEDLEQFDQDHFLGIQSTNLCIDLLKIDRTSKVLDIGSGLGGPARSISHRTGCSVLGVEIQDDRFASSENLTKIINLQDKVKFLHEDISKANIESSAYTHVISFLAILHVIDKKKILKRIGNFLVKGGFVYIEDYYSLKKPTTEQAQKLLEIISCPNLITKGEYSEFLSLGGIQVEHLIDTTDEWKALVYNRLDDFIRAKDLYAKKYGKIMIDNAESFFSGVNCLYENGLVGGMRIIGKKIR